jgi:hypothetical protein
MGKGSDDSSRKSLRYIYTFSETLNDLTLEEQLLELDDQS